MTQIDEKAMRDAFNTQMPTTARGWAFALAEASNAAARVGASADEETYLLVIEAIIKQATTHHEQQIKELEQPMLKAREALQRIYETTNDIGIASICVAALTNMEGN